MPELITGTKGTPHITSTQDRAIYEKIIGKNSYILDDNELLEPELQSNQSLRIRSGMLYHHGSITEVKRNTYDEVTIANGSQGMKRIDLVVARYTKNPETEIEEMNWVVIQGTPAASDPVAPAYIEGNMQEGDLTDDCPVFEVHLDGIQVTEVVKLLTVLSGSLESLNSNKASVEIIEDSDSFHNIRIGNLQIVSGTIIPLSQGEYVQLFTLAQLKQYFGNDFALNRFEITTRNGDATSANVHFYEPEYWPGNQAFYQYYYPSRGTGLGVQVYYTMTYIHPAT